MSIKFVSLFILLITVVFISGCVKDGGNSTQVPTPHPQIKSEFIPTTQLPSGFTYMGTHKVSLDIGDSSIDATEGVYRSKGNDIYIQVIETDNSEKLINQYKERYKDANYNPFEEISLNEHKATKIKDYITINGQQEPTYSIIWTNENLMFIVGSSSDLQGVMNLASSIGR